MEQEQQDNLILQPNTPPKKKKIGWLIILICVIFITGGISWYYHTMLRQTENEERDYALLEENYNPKDYEAYVHLYPEGTHIQEVKKRLTKLHFMIERWEFIQNSSHAGDFIDFKNRYSDPQYTRLCDIKIDSLDWIAASATGTEAAYALYLEQHPDGRYASEASIAQGNMRDLEVTPSEHDMLVQVCSSFFKGIETLDETAICCNIVPTMSQFFSKPNATKAEVLTIIKGMFNEHIKSCHFVINRDFNIVKVPDTTGSFIYHAEFSIDQHIERSNKGKTFGSFRATAELTSDILIRKLTLEELSKS